MVIFHQRLNLMILEIFLNLNVSMNELFFFYSSASLQRALWDALQKCTLTEEMAPTHFLLKKAEITFIDLFHLCASIIEMQGFTRVKQVLWHNIATVIH